MRLSFTSGPIAAAACLFLLACAGRDSTNESAEHALTGVAVVKDIRTLKGLPTDSSNPRAFIELGNTTYFLGSRGGMTSLFKTDGTPDGTLEITEIAMGSTVGNELDGRLVAHQGKLLATLKGKLWLLDPATSASVVVPNVETAGPIASTSLGTLFTGTVGGVHGLYLTDGTEAGTKFLGTSPLSQSSAFLTSGNQVLVVGGNKLGAVVTDGTPAGTGWAGTMRPDFGAPLAAGGFLVANAAGAVERIATDKTGTALSLPAPDGAARAPQVRAMIALGDRVLIAGDVVKDGSGALQELLWISDGTAEGTSLLASAETGRTLRDDAPPSGNARLDDGKAYVRSGGALWESDGTAEGTRALSLPSGDLSFHELVIRGGKIATISQDVADATQTSLVLVDIASGAAESAANDASRPALYARGASLAATPLGILYAGGAGDQELCASDGTAAGTRHVTNIDNLGEASSAPDGFYLGSAKGRAFAVVGDKFLFTADDGVHGRELWASDGTTAGTTMVSDLTQGAASTTFVVGNENTVLGDTFLFQTGSVEAGRALYATDGTEAGTRLLVPEVTAPRQGVGVAGVIASAGFAYFVTASADGKRQLQRTDGVTVEALFEVLGQAPAEGEAVMTRLLPLDGGLVVWNERVLGSPNEIISAWATAPDGTFQPVDLAGGQLLLNESAVAYFRKPTPEGTAVVRIQVGVPVATSPAPGLGTNGCVGLAGGALVFIDGATGDLRLSDGVDAMTIKAGVRKPNEAECREPSITSSGSAVLFDQHGAIITNGMANLTFDVPADAPKNGVVADGRGFFFSDASANLHFWNGSSASKIRENTFIVGSIPGGIMFRGREAADPAGQSRRFYRTDGRTGGTIEVLQGMRGGAVFTPFEDRLFFSGVDNGGDGELWSGKL